MEKLIILLIVMPILVACSTETRLDSSNVGSLAANTTKKKEDKKQDDN